MDQRLDPTDLVRTKYWHLIDDQRVQCDVCPRYCRLREGQRGMCFVRAAHGGEIVLATYGRSSGFCIDPIEKKPLNHFLPGTSVLSFGTAGCNLACAFCQNWDISKSREVDTLSDRASPAELADAAVRHGCRSMAFTYNDPVVFHEYAIDVAKACHDVNVKTVAVTAGYQCPDPRAEFYEHMDAANVDLKGFTDDFYWRITKAHLDPVLDTLRYLARDTDVWLEITNLVIPEKNDSMDDIARMADWLVEHVGPNVPLHFTAFHPDYRMRDLPNTPPSTLSRARDVAKAAGMLFVYTGNVHDAIGGTTACVGCGADVIGRDWFALTFWNLDEHHACADCGTVCPGVFDPAPGTWGSRRQRVTIPGR